MIIFSIPKNIGKGRDMVKMKELVFPFIHSLKKMKSQTLAYCSQTPGIAIPCSWCKNIVVHPENYLRSLHLPGIRPRQRPAICLLTFWHQETQRTEIELLWASVLISYHLLQKHILHDVGKSASIPVAFQFFLESSLKCSTECHKDQFGFCLRQRAAPLHRWQGAV